MFRNHLCLVFEVLSLYSEVNYTMVCIEILSLYSEVNFTIVYIEVLSCYSVILSLYSKVLSLYSEVNICIEVTMFVCVCSEVKTPLNVPQPLVPGV